MKALQSPKAIFFDLDETLITNTSNFDDLIKQVYATHIGHADATELHRFQQALMESALTVWQRIFEKGNSGDQLLAESFQTALTNSGQTGPAADMASHFFEIAAAATQVNESAYEVLAAIKQRGIATGIITNGFTRLQSAKIKRHGLNDFFDTIVISEQAGTHKPDRKIFEYALSMIGATAANTWHLGDHQINDIKGAKDAGLTAFLYHPEIDSSLATDSRATDLESISCNHRIADLRELLALVSP